MKERNGTNEKIATVDGNSVINVEEETIYLFGFKILGTIGRLNGLSFPPNLSWPDSFLPPKPPPKKITDII